jgi:hypothetical protein
LPSMLLLCHPQRVKLYFIGLRSALPHEVDMSRIYSFDAAARVMVPHTPKVLGADKHDDMFDPVMRIRWVDGFCVMLRCPYDSRLWAALHCIDCPGSQSSLYCQRKGCLCSRRWAWKVRAIAPGASCHSEPHAVAEGLVHTVVHYWRHHC